MTNDMQQPLPVREGSSLPKAWVVTTVFNRNESVAKYLACLDRQSFRNFSLVLVDHGTQPLSLDIKFPEYVTLLRGSSEMWWTGAVNTGIRYLLESEDVADQDIIILQNDDSIFGPEFVESLVSAASTEQAVIGSVAINATTGRILHASLKFNKMRARYDYLHYGKPINELADKLYESDVLKGRGVAYPVRVVRRIGLLDESLPHYKSDHEWAHRAKTMGYGVYVIPGAISETVLDTQKQVSSDAPFLSLWRVLVSRRSPKNIVDTVKFFFICFRPIPATYYCLVDISRTSLVSLIAAILYKLKFRR
ncbi:MAG: glycosyltransferase [Pseudomonadota bacterium]|nr:glycosyltransferase [Pseudomonadota bacterium]